MSLQNTKLVSNKVYDREEDKVQPFHQSQLFNMSHVILYSYWLTKM